MFIEDTQVQGSLFSQHFSNATVSGCSIRLYESMIEYAKQLVSSRRSDYEPLDLVHDAFLFGVDETNYKSKIKGLFFSELQNATESFNDEFEVKRNGVETLICKRCEQELPTGAFTTRKGGYFNTVCYQCEKELGKIGRKNLSDAYMRSLIRGSKMKIKDVSQESLEVKKLEVFLTRVSQAIKYKHYGKRFGKKQTYTKPKVSRKKAK